MNNPLIKQQEQYNKITDLVNLIKNNPDPRELKRALAIKMSIERQSDEIIAQILGVSKSFIRDWKKAFKAEGIAGIKLGYQGAKGKLTSEQRIEIIEWLKNSVAGHPPSNELLVAIVVELRITSRILWCPNYWARYPFSGVIDNKGYEIF